MLRDIRKNKIFTRRVMILSAAQSALASALVMRLGYLQLWKHEEYSIQSDSNRIKPIINPAPRGTIYDRNDVPLTTNTNNYRLLLYLRRKGGVDEVIEKLSKVLDLTEEQKNLFHSRVKNARRKM